MASWNDGVLAERNKILEWLKKIEREMPTISVTVRYIGNEIFWGNHWESPPTEPLRMYPPVIEMGIPTIGYPDDEPDEKPRRLGRMQFGGNYGGD